MFDLQYRNSRIIFLIILLTSSLSYTKAVSPYKAAFYSSFISRNMTKWEKLIEEVEKSDYVQTNTEKLELINYYYGYVGYLLGQKRQAEAESYIIKGEKLINEVLKSNPSNATAYSFKGAFLGFEVGVNNLKVIYLESESKAHINKALQLDPNNIQALIDKANILFYAPRLLGGSKQKALNYYLKASNIIETNKDTKQNWVYLNLLTMIAISYEKTGAMNEAKQAYEKILTIEPNIVWIKDDLYPKFMKRNTSK